MSIQKTLEDTTGQIIDLHCVYEWIKAENNRKNTLLLMKLPLTAKQISSKLHIKPSTCSHILKDFTTKNLTSCLNPTAKNSRLYYLTTLGKHCQDMLCHELQKTIKDFPLPDTNWNLYGWLCFNHRSAIAKIINEPMQPSQIKRQLYRRNPDINISANNIRDIIKLFEKRDIVEKVYLKKKAHPRYKLTDIGKQLQELLKKEKACY
ncbi:MAG: hypothetical protein JEZ07_15990 [Phycisphaerae bacterium]|nr:hypothetical protein [Phycisphaerae bacterium]